MRRLVCVKPCAYRCQSLDKHLSSVCEKTKRFISAGYLETVARRFSYCSLRADKKLLESTILTAAFFHDVGKAVEYYQERFDEKCECISRRCSFYLHELLSAAYLNKYFSQTSACDENLTILAVLAVLNHMHALRDYAYEKEYFRPESPKKSSKIDEIFRKSYVRSEHVEQLVNPFMEASFLDLSVLRKVLNEPVNPIDVQVMLNKIGEAESSKTFLKLYVMILLPIVLADNLDAVEHRPSDDETKSRKAFLNELKYLAGELS
ncbi:MAG: CRISPR-associated endonuclease Cas3'' [Candidatus Caldarchaeum sp.]